MKIIRVEEDKAVKHFGNWLHGFEHVSLRCVKKNDGYGWWHEIVHKSEKKFLVFDYVIATIYSNNEVHLYHPQYFSDIEMLVQKYESECGQQVTVKVYES